jgi:hypothetical protein
MAILNMVFNDQYKEARARVEDDLSEAVTECRVNDESKIMRLFIGEATSSGRGQVWRRCQVVADFLK